MEATTLIISGVLVWLIIGLVWMLSQCQKTWRQAKQMGMEKWFPLSVVFEVVAWPIGMIGARHVKKHGPIWRKK